jgi:TctA family transporter
MEHLISSAWHGLLLVFMWPNIVYPIAGTLAAMLFAFMPGLSGVTLMALAIPLTLHWDPLPVMLLFGALLGGATFMGSVTAILFNIPGTGPSAATMIDGHPLAQQGHARTALGCAAMSSALGSSVGVLVLILLIPVMRHAILTFGSAEFMMLAVWGLTTVAAVSRGSMLKGLAAAGVGLLVSFVGFDPRTAELRYTFGSLYLHDGLSLVPVFLGIVAIAETIDLAVRSPRTISGKARVQELSGSLWLGMSSVFTHFGLFIRSSLIGTVIGMIPAVGGTVASFVAYGHAAQSAGRDRERFGRGDIRGVIAPEAAHDAKDGASLVPTLALGVPGSEGAALFLAALTLHGLAPGHQLMDTQLNLVFALIWSLFLSNWLTSIIGLAMVGRLAHLTVVRTEVLTPVVFSLALLGVYSFRGQAADLVTALIFGVGGYFMKKHGWPRIPLVMALLLGPLFETSFHLTLRLQEVGRINLWTRPVTLAFIVLAVVTLILPVVQSLRARQRQSP